MINVRSANWSRHIIIVNDRASPDGGASKVALQSAIGLASRGYAVTVIAAIGPVWHQLTAAGIDVHILDQLDLARGRRSQVAVQAIWNRKAEHFLSGFLASQPKGHTVVHIHSWSKALSASVFSAASHSGHPVVATLHDYGLVCPNGALHDFPLGRACQLRPMSVSCVTRNCDARSYVHKAWRVLRQVALQNIAQVGTTLTLAICVSSYSHDVMRPLLPAKLRTVVVENPIDAVLAAPADPAASRQFLYVGRLSREKGVLIAAEAARHARVPITFIGEGELRSEVMAANPSASITGWLPPEEVRRMLRSGRCVIIPSTWRETQGMVLPEAQACGVPIIASDNTAPGAAILPGRTGLIFKNGSAEALASAMSVIATDDQLVSRMGSTAYEQYWKSPPSLERHVEKLETVYADAL